MEQRARFEKEAHLLLGFIHSSGMNTIRDLIASGAQQQSRAPPNSWLAQQRSNVRDISVSGIRGRIRRFPIARSTPPTIALMEDPVLLGLSHINTNYRTFSFSLNFLYHQYRAMGVS